MNQFVTLLGIVAMCLSFDPTNAIVDKSIVDKSIVDKSIVDRSMVGGEVNHNLFERLFNRKFTVQSVGQTSGNFTCDAGKVAAECSYHGICRDDGKSCVCSDGYTTSQSSSIQCDYKQKDTVAAFLLELFLGQFGGGYFYLGLIPPAVGQLCLFVLGLIPLCFIVCMGALTESEGCVFVLAACYSCLWTIAVIGWWIASLVMIARATIVDGNGMPFPTL